MTHQNTPNAAAVADVIGEAASEHTERAVYPTREQITERAAEITARAQGINPTLAATLAELELVREQLSKLRGSLAFKIGFHGQAGAIPVSEVAALLGVEPGTGGA